MIQNVPYHPEFELDQPKRWSLEAEQSVLGAILQRSDLFAELPPELTANDFCHRHGKIFNAFGELYADNTAIDVISVAEKIGGDHLDYLTDLATNTVAHNTHAYAKVILSYSQKRNIERIGIRMNQLAYDDMDPQEKLNLINAELQTLEHTTNEEEGEGVNAVLKRVIAGIDYRFRGGEPLGLKTGFEDIDKKIIAMQPGQLFIVAGRPSMGKTTLAMNIVRRVIQEKHNVLVFSIETTKERLIERMMSEIARLELGKIRTGQLDSDGDWAKLELAARTLKDKNFVLSDVSNIHINRAMSVTRKLNRRKKIDLVVVDYLQLMDGDGGNRNLQVAHVSRGLKAMAKELDCPVIAVAQLNRDGVGKPRLKDLRDSGQIEQDADVVMLIHRDDYENENCDRPGVADIHIAKNKDGETGIVCLATKFQYNALEDISKYIPAKPDKPHRDFYND